MAVYMISYDLINAEEEKYENVHKAIEDSSSESCHYWDSTFLIKSELTPEQITDKISQYLDKKDRLIVIKALSNYQGRLTKDQWKYIKENIFS